MSFLPAKRRRRSFCPTDRGGIVCASRVAVGLPQIPGSGCDVDGCQDLGGRRREHGRLARLRGARQRQWHIGAVHAVLITFLSNSRPRRRMFSLLNLRRAAFVPAGLLHVYHPARLHAENKAGRAMPAHRKHQQQPEEQAEDRCPPISYVLNRRSHVVVNSEKKDSTQRVIRSWAGAVL